MSTTLSSRIRVSRAADTIGVLAVVTGLLLGLVPGIAPAAAEAGHGTLSAGQFEIDGNTAGAHDWAGMGGQQTADGTGNGDASFFDAGLKESHYPNWTFSPGANAPKADLEQVFVQSQLAATGSFIWLGASRVADEGNVQVTAEFNKSELTLASMSGAYRQVGDFFIRFNFPGSKGADVDVFISSWNGTAWGPETELTANVHFKYAVGTLGASSREFIELEINLAGLFGGGGPLACGSFGSVSFRTEASGGNDNNNDPTLKDIAGPFAIDLDTCATVTVQKNDEDGDGLVGAQFTLYPGANTAGTPVSGTGITNPCTTDASGDCSFGTVQPGQYTIDETTVPPGYSKAGTLPDTFTVVQNVPVTRTYTDPRIPYTIAVTPETATNALDETNADASLHKFTVTLTADGSPLGSQTVGLSWSGGVGDIVKVDDSTTVLDECTTDASGTCDVWVNTTAPGGGTLTASWDTPYQNTVSSPSPLPSTTATGGTPSTTAYPTIADSGDKDWVGLDASIAANGLNLLGDPHDFTVYVWEVDGTGADDGTEAGSEASGVTVNVSWSGPTGSTIDGNATTSSCVTANDGTCTVTVDSDDNGGTGTATVTQVSGTVTGGETAKATFSAGERTATKTWRIYRASIDDDSVNPAGQSHTFTVTVQYSDDNGATWENPGAGVSVDWDGPTNGSNDLATSTCDNGTDVDGTCTIVVYNDAPGVGTVTVTEVDGDLLHDGGVGDDGPYDVTDVSATKTWLSFAVEITDPAVNLVDEAHTFRVEVKYSDGGDYEPVPAGTNVAWTDSDDLRVTNESCTSGTGDDPDTGATETNVCFITVNSSSPGTFDITVTGVDDFQFTGRTEDVDFNEAAESSKTWVAYRAWIESDGLNLVRDDHDFTVHVQQEDGSGWSAVPDGTTVTVTSAGVGSTTNTSCETTSGSCTVTVASDDAGTRTVSVGSVEAKATDAFDDTADVSGGTDLTGDQSASAAKMWIAFRADISNDSVNITGDSHDFTVLAEYTTDGSTWNPVPDGTSVTYTDDEAVGDPATDTCDSTGTSADDSDGECTITVTSDTSGVRAVTVTGLSATITANGITDTFPVTFGTDNDGVMTFTADDYQATKTWASYTLQLDPAAATNLLSGEADDPERYHTITATLTSDDAVNAPVDGQTVDVAISGAGTISSVEDGDVEPDGLTATCVTNGVGTCEIVIFSASPGQATVSGSYQAAVGESETTTVDADDVTKTWTTFRVTVTPETAVNLVRNAHVFTVTVEQSTSDGVWVPVVGAEPTIDVTGSGLTVDTSDCDAGTDDNGQCTVTVTSSTVQAVTLTATHTESYDDYDSEVEGQSTVAFSDRGDKTWIDYDIDVTPDTADNLVDTDHVFTVTVTTTFAVEGGTQTEPVVDGTVDVTLNGLGSISDNGCADGTDANGQCTVTITSPVAGGSSLTAEYMGTASDDAEVRSYSDTALKDWVDYELVMSDDAVNAVGDEHTFTATLTVDTGEGFGPAAGETLAFSVDGVGTVTGGDVDSDLTCVTDADGQCDILINSDEAGATNVGVSYDAVVSATSRTDTADAVKQWVDIELLKTAVTGDGLTDGDLIADPGGLPFLAFTSSDTGPKTAVFEYLITNPSNVTLENVVLTDDRLGTIDLSLFPACQTLDPGESCTARGNEQFDYDDATAALGAPITNVGVVTATGGGEDVSDTDDATIGLVAVQSSILIDLVKQVVVDAGDVTMVDGLPIVRWSQEEYESGASKTVRYRFTVTNISNAPIIDVELLDPMISDQPIIPKADGVTLQPDESRVIEVDHTLTVGEAFPDGPIATKVDNVASVSGANETRDSFSEATDDASVFTEIVFAEVLEKDPPLPATGLDSGGLLPLSMLLIAIGAAILWLDRRGAVAR